MPEQPKDANQNYEAEMEDQAGQAVESGEPGETGRSHGKVIDDQGEPMGGKAQDVKKQHWESGRHQAD